MNLYIKIKTLIQTIADRFFAPRERSNNRKARNVWTRLLRSLGWISMVAVMCGCVSAKSKMSSTPDGVSVTPERYRDVVLPAYWHSAAILEKHGYTLQHKITTVEVVTTGLIRGPSGKLGFPYAYSATGIAGGTTGGSKIRVAVDENGEIYLAAIRHEWGHAILQGNNFIGDQEAELRRMGL